MSYDWLAILLVLPLLPLQVFADGEDTRSLEIVGQKGMILDHEGKYVNTESVWMYVVAYSTILSLILLAGCINLCWIRWHYRRKCADVIERMEKQHQRKLETQGDPSPFGVPIKVAAEGMQPAKPKETMALAWDPATLAQVLHNMAVDPATVQSYMPAPYPGVALNYGDQRPPPRDTEAQTGGNCISTVGQSSAVQAGSHA